MIGLSLAIFLAAVPVMAYKITTLKYYEYTGFIEDQNNGHTKVYTVDQEKATCYIAVTTAPNRQPATGISCLEK